jgi:hypothetical protein
MRIITKDDAEYERRSKVFNENKYECKHCGHKVVVPKYKKKNLCDWCNNYVFCDPKDEFEYRMNEINRRIYGK